jgi:hypothetical protein
MRYRVTAGDRASVTQRHEFSEVVSSMDGFAPELIYPWDRCLRAGADLRATMVDLELYRHGQSARQWLP